MTQTQSARIFRSSKRVFDCLLASGESVSATALAVLLKEDHLVVGDWVQLQQETSSEWTIISVNERSSTIFRNLPREQKHKVIASNVDRLIVVVSAGKPAYKRGLVDRYLVRMAQWGVPALVVFNKMDLFEGEFDLEFESQRLQDLGVDCYEISSEDAHYQPRFLKNGFAELQKELHGKTAITLGHSGVGKSRLISALSDGQISLLSGELGKVGKGAHTTTWAELVPCQRFTLIDSPGVRSMSLADLPEKGLLSYFPDLEEHATHCKFTSCKHMPDSKGCWFWGLDMNESRTEQIHSRLDSYQRILEEVSRIPDWKKNEEKF